MIHLLSRSRAWKVLREQETPVQFTRSTSGGHHSLHPPSGAKRFRTERSRVVRESRWSDAALRARGQGHCVFVNAVEIAIGYFNAGYERVSRAWSLLAQEEVQVQVFSGKHRRRVDPKFCL